MHIIHFDNANKPIVDCDHALVPLNYFNIVKLCKGQSFEYQILGYETCIVPATGTVNIQVSGQQYNAVGKRRYTRKGTRDGTL